MSSISGTSSESDNGGSLENEFSLEMRLARIPGCSRRRSQTSRGCGRRGQGIRCGRCDCHWSGWTTHLTRSRNHGKPERWRVPGSPGSRLCVWKQMSRRVSACLQRTDGSQSHAGKPSQMQRPADSLTRSTRPWQGSRHGHRQPHVPRTARQRF